MDLSIIIPVFNESLKIQGDISQAVEFLTEQNLAGEIIVCDDGSTDDTVLKVNQTDVSDKARLESISLAGHRGKGAAVRQGVLKSTGKYVMFCDSGSCIPYSQAVRGLEMLKAGQCDIAHASRKLPESVIVRDKSLYRRVCSSLFRLLMGIVAKVPRHLTDTQCGLKLFTGDIGRKLFAQCTTDGFLFDIEIILLADKAGYTIREFPVEWKCDADSRLSSGQSTIGILRDIWKMRKIYKRINRHSDPQSA